MDIIFMKCCFTLLVVMITTEIQAKTLDNNPTENVSFDPECKSETCLRAEAVKNFLPPIKAGKKTYYLQTFFSTDWFEANQFCRYINMRLASIDSEEESDKLKNGIVTIYGTSKVHFWTSGNDLVKLGNYFWASTGASFQFTDWRQGEPNHSNNGGEIERCVEITGDKGTLAWNDVPCSFKIYLVCET